MKPRIRVFAAFDVDSGRHIIEVGAYIASREFVRKDQKGYQEIGVFRPSGATISNGIEDNGAVS